MCNISLLYFTPSFAYLLLNTSHTYFTNSDIIFPYIFHTIIVLLNTSHTVYILLLFPCIINSTLLPRCLKYIDIAKCSVALQMQYTSKGVNRI